MGFILKMMKVGKNGISKLKKGVSKGEQFLMSDGTIKFCHSLNFYNMKVLDSKILIKSKCDGLVEKIGGFEVPVGAGEYAVAEVVAVGDKIENVKAGDTVYYYQNAGKELTIDGEKYRVITSSEVLVVL